MSPGICDSPGARDSCKVPLFKTSGKESSPLDVGILATYWSRVDARSGEASWRSGYAEDCKSLHPGSIPGEASSFLGNRRRGPIRVQLNFARHALKAGPVEHER